MASGSMKEIKNHIKSMEGTRQLTKAMQMVAQSKLRRAKERMETTRPYFRTFYETISDIIATDRNLSSPYTEEREKKTVLYIVFAGDRGLAGGFNSNILKQAYKEMQGCTSNSQVIPVGKKAYEFFQKRKDVTIVSPSYSVVESLGMGDCFSIARYICEAFKAGRVDQVKLEWTSYESSLSQIPRGITVLPLSKKQYVRKKNNKDAHIIYEPSPEEAFDAFVPEYVGGMLYGALCDSYASELAARSNAMESASKTADEMIEELSLKFNRARQGAITQEITEVTSSADA